MSSDVEDLVAFLHEKNKLEVRKAAAGIINGLTAAADGIEHLRPVQGPLITALLRLVPSSDTSLSKSALTSLVNLAQDQRWAAVLLQDNVVGRVMEFIREQSCAHVQLLLMLLVNVTALDKGCEDLLQLDKPSMQGLHMAMLLKAFVTSAVTLLPGQPDTYQHIAALLTNTTRLQQGRQLLLQPGRGFLQALAAQLQPGCCLQRRQGCAGALRNVCISAEADGTLDELLADEAVLLRLLAPLGGTPAAATPAHQQQPGGSPVAPGVVTAAAAAAGQAAGQADVSPADSILHQDMQQRLSLQDGSSAAVASSTHSSSSSALWRDPDEGVREALAEAIAALAAVSSGRKALWNVSTPEVLRTAYEQETCPDVCRAMEAAARSFMFDCDGRQLELEEDDGGGGGDVVREQEEGQGQQGGQGRAGIKESIDDLPCDQPVSKCAGDVVNSESCS